MVIGKLGKHPRKVDARTFLLAKYLPKILPPITNRPDWQADVKRWPMYLNDNLGCCVASAAGHMINQWTRLTTGQETLVQDADILKSYEDVGGYVPGDPSTDNGINMLDFLNYWRSTGVGGHKILGYAQVNVANKDMVLQAIQLFGNLFIGVQLPISAQSEDQLWSVPKGGAVGNGQPGSWGGHCIPGLARLGQTVPFITWGMLLQMSYSSFNDFFDTYVDEAYAVFSQDWLNKAGISPGLFNQAQLEADLGQL